MESTLNARGGGGGGTPCKNLNEMVWNDFTLTAAYGIRVLTEIS